MKYNKENFTLKINKINSIKNSIFIYKLSDILINIKKFFEDEI